MFFSCCYTVLININMFLFKLEFVSFIRFLLPVKFEQRFKVFCILFYLLSNLTVFYILNVFVFAPYSTSSGRKK